MLSRKGTAPISQGEKNKVISYIASQQGFVTSPVNNIAKFLLENFSWPLSTGKIRAKAVIDLLLKEKIIAAILNRKGLKSISLMSAQKPEDSSNPRLVKPEVVPLPLAGSSVLVESSVVVQRRRYQPQKKGVARSRRQREVVGERAERRLYDLSLKIASILKNKFPDLITDISVSRSGRHNPKKGKIDLQDSAGEDITILITLYDQGRYRKERIIYDAKNSKWSVLKFNSHIRLYLGQTGAILKKAIGTGKMMSDREIADEILRDMISVQLLPEHCRQDALSSFGEM